MPGAMFAAPGSDRLRLHSDSDSRWPWPCCERERLSQARDGAARGCSAHTRAATAATVRSSRSQAPLRRHPKIAPAIYPRVVSSMRP
jgi:hypothetical protein